MSFEIISPSHLTCDALTALLHNEIGAVRIPNFVSANFCRSATAGIKAHGIGFYDNVHPRVGRIGITQNEHKNRPDGKLEYFEKVVNAHELRKRILQESGDCLTFVMDFLQSLWEGKVGLAFEEDLQKFYFAGLVRVIHRALLHFDWAQWDARGWDIERISAQLSWNIYLQTGLVGGATRIYQRLWQESDEVYRIPGSYGYDTTFIRDCESVTLYPEPGELVLFNSRNFHEVEQTEGEEERITISSFIGWLESTNQLVFWS